VGLFRRARSWREVTDAPNEQFSFPPEPGTLPYCVAGSANRTFWGASFPNMGRRRGRAPGRELTELELEHLRLLLEVRERAHSYARHYDEQLEDFVLRMREDGSSARVIAAQLGVGGSTVQNWIASAVRRREP